MDSGIPHRQKSGHPSKWMGIAKCVALSRASHSALTSLGPVPFFASSFCDTLFSLWFHLGFKGTNETNSLTNHNCFFSRRATNKVVQHEGEKRISLIYANSEDICAGKRSMLLVKPVPYSHFAVLCFSSSVCKDLAKLSGYGFKKYMKNGFP